MTRVVLTGAAGPVGRRVLLDLLDGGATSVVALDRRPIAVPEHESSTGVPSPTSAVVESHQVQLRSDALDRFFAGADVVCHLAGSDPLEDVAADHDLHTTTRVLEAAGRAGARQVVTRSSATVYGAWPDNPVPLPETAPTRPNAETEWVRVRAAIEERVHAFAEAHPDVAVAVLRPCVTVSPDGPDELGRVLATARLVSAAHGEPQAQFVHVDDVAAAVGAVVSSRASGVFNVAPDGALDADMIRALVGGAPRIPLPEGVARRLTAFGWRYRLAPTPPGFVPFVQHSWVVANDRLRALGWEATHTNEEAFVAGHLAAPWAQISPQRRQELALGLAAGLLVGVGTGVGFGVRRLLRQARSANVTTTETG